MGEGTTRAQQRWWEVLVGMVVLNVWRSLPAGYLPTFSIPEYATVVLILLVVTRYQCTRVTNLLAFFSRFQAFQGFRNGAGSFSQTGRVLSPLTTFLDSGNMQHRALYERHYPNLRFIQVLPSIPKAPPLTPDSILDVIHSTTSSRVSSKRSRDVPTTWALPNLE